MPRSFIFALVLGALWIATPLPGQVTLKGIIRNLPANVGRQMTVEFWDTNRWSPIASFDLQTDGSFQTIVKSEMPAQCRIRVLAKPRAWSDFIIPGPDNPNSVLVFDLDYTQMFGHTAHAEGTWDHCLYETIMREYRLLAGLRDSLAGKPSLRLDTIQRNFNRLCRKVWTEDRGLFAADVVARLFYQPMPEDYPNSSAALTPNLFAQAHYFDKTPFANSGILHHNEFRKKIDLYDGFYEKTPENSPKRIDGIMRCRNGNDAVDAFLFRHLLEKMMGEQDETGLSYLLNWYSPDCGDENKDPDGMDNMTAAFRNCTPGKAAFDLKLPGPSGVIQSLSTVCAKHKVTLLFFWRSNCSACAEFKPELERIYEKYQPLGLEVYAISLDASESAWQTFVAEHPQKWVQVFVPQAQRNAVARQFPTPGTPTLIALDTNRKVLNRLVVRADLDAYLGSILKKQ
ncbi:MAG: thioredoxin family protein [Bacteroidota bacterium]